MCRVPSTSHKRSRLPIELKLELWHELFTLLVLGSPTRARPTRSYDKPVDVVWRKDKPFERLINIYLTPWKSFQNFGEAGNRLFRLERFLELLGTGTAYEHILNN
jgi:hypothetical protein